ncbi:hypothetical protein F5Y14DRAFT_459823 [Nemania sp. NC0429]|nr:hypothetical protein F5Y14DRAFT_459823 [Nemania sp. NC0429]
MPSSSSSPMPLNMGSRPHLLSPQLHTFTLNPRRRHQAPNLTPRSPHVDAVVASPAPTPRVIINNTIRRQKQARDQHELVLEPHSHPTHTPRHARPPPLVIQPNSPSRPTRDDATRNVTMCVNEIFTELRPDGRQRTWSEADYCYRSRDGRFCDRTQELRRPLGYRRVESRGQLPPTPPLSHHSDYASDSDRSGKRRSAIYINDHKVVDINRRRSLRQERPASGERALYMDHSPLRSPLRSPLSPLSRTPPIHHHRSISSSPARDVYGSVESGSYRSANDRERPTSIKVEIINERPKAHRRETSSSKTNSSRDSNDDERRQRRLSDLHPGDQQRQRLKETEIARQNEAIANRRVPPPTSSVQSYRRGSVSIASASQLQERKRLEEEKKLRHREKKEEEAQKQRLKDRFTFKSTYPYA